MPREYFNWRGIFGNSTTEDTEVDLEVEAPIDPAGVAGISQSPGGTVWFTEISGAAIPQQLTATQLDALRESHRQRAEYMESFSNAIIGEYIPMSSTEKKIKSCQPMCYPMCAKCLKNVRKLDIL